MTCFKNCLNSEEQHLIVIQLEPKSCHFARLKYLREDYSRRVRGVKYFSQTQNCSCEMERVNFEIEVKASDDEGSREVKTTQKPQGGDSKLKGETEEGEVSDPGSRKSQTRALSRSRSRSQSRSRSHGQWFISW